MWESDRLASIAAEALARASESADAEQAPVGPDAWDEPALQHVLARGYADAGHPVLREQPYPTPSPGRRSERPRCDLVLLPPGAAGLIDPFEQRRERAALRGTLFAEVAGNEPAAATGSVGPREACWLEVKSIGQHVIADGVARANPSWGADLVAGPAADLAKLAADPELRHAAVLLVLFAASDAVIDHDVAVAAHRWLDRSAAFSAPRIVTYPVADRIGNGRGAVVVARVRPG